MQENSCKLCVNICVKALKETSQDGERGDTICHLCNIIFF